jgi:hypothetical protein
MEMSIHLTGLYPKWWTGKKFLKPIRAWVCGASNETTRDICQKELFGQPDNPRDKGKGYATRLKMRRSVSGTVGQEGRGEVGNREERRGGG